MDIVGIIIAVVAVVALVAMLVWLFATGFNNRWPKGERFEAKRGIHKLTLIVSDGAKGERSFDRAWYQQAVEHYARALWATATGWQVVKKGNPKDLAEAAVHLLSDEEYEAQVHPLLKTSVAYQVTVLRRVGHGPILVVMRANLAEHATKRGEPVIHELIHALGGDRSHEDETMWSEHASNTESLQAYARDRFSGL